MGIVISTGSIHGMADEVLKKAWGNPEAKQFKHQKIRTVHEGGVTVLVHKELVELVRELVLKAHRMRWVLPDAVEGYEKGDGTSPRHYGLAMKAHTAPLTQYAAELGWSATPDGEWLFWGDSPEKAQEAAEQAAEHRARDTVDLPAPGGWESRLPGTRELEEGDKGDDVEMFQLALGCPSNQGVYDAETGRYAEAINTRLRTDGGNRVTYATWRGLLRRRETTYDRGDRSLQVRCIQAALSAYNWSDDVQVTGRYDRATYAAVQYLQECNGFRQSGSVRAPEWAVLFHLPSV